MATESATPVSASLSSDVGKTKIDRHDFGVSWNSSMKNAGLVVGTEV
jgi:hypothetical protein